MRNINTETTHDSIVLKCPHNNIVRFISEIGISRRLQVLQQVCATQHVNGMFHLFPQMKDRKREIRNFLTSATQKIRSASCRSKRRNRNQFIRKADLDITKFKQDHPIKHVNRELGENLKFTQQMSEPNKILKMTFKYCT